MKKIRIITVRKRVLVIIGAVSILFLALLPYGIRLINTVQRFIDPMNGIIIIDPGHGGIDGGTGSEELLEKDINLSISFKVKEYLERNGYTVLMTRGSDVSLEDFDRSSSSRHIRDLRARVNMINASHAQLFISIHVNSNPKKPSTNGSIVFFGSQYEESRLLAASIQKKLNKVPLDGGERMIHDPKEGSFYILDNTKIPGVIIETAFISNSDEKRLLEGEKFRDSIASAISEGIMSYLYQRSQAIVQQ